MPQYEVSGLGEDCNEHDVEVITAEIIRVDCPDGITVLIFPNGYTTTAVTEDFKKLAR